MLYYCYYFWVFLILAISQNNFAGFSILQNRQFYRNSIKGGFDPATCFVATLQIWRYNYKLSLNCLISGKKSTKIPYFPLPQGKISVNQAHPSITWYQYYRKFSVPLNTYSIRFTPKGVIDTISDYLKKTQNTGTKLS